MERKHAQVWKENMRMYGKKTCASMERKHAQVWKENMGRGSSQRRKDDERGKAGSTRGENENTRS